MSTIIHEHTRASDIYRPAGAVIALWDDVVAATNGHPYILTRIASISTDAICTAQERGYFAECLARRINDATVSRVRLVPHEHQKSGKRLKEQEQAIVTRRV